MKNVETNNWSRRKILVTGLGACSLLCGCSISKHPKQNSFNGCFASIVSGYLPQLHLSLRNSSGRADFDSLLKSERRKLSGTFGVNPAFSFFEEPQNLGPNALATSERILNPKSDGTILFGTRFIEKITYDPKWGINVAAPSDLRTILAHEYAHIFQLNLNGVYSMPTPWRELQADFLAAWHIGKDITDERFLPFSGMGLYGLGDLNYTNPDHHGTNPQRLVMGLEGAYYSQEFPNASAENASQMAASLLRIKRDRIFVHATRRWFEDSKVII